MEWLKRNLKRYGRSEKYVETLLQVMKTVGLLLILFIVLKFDYISSCGNSDDKH